MAYFYGNLDKMTFEIEKLGQIGGGEINKYFLLTPLRLRCACLFPPLYFCREGVVSRSESGGELNNLTLSPYSIFV